MRRQVWEWEKGVERWTVFEQEGEVMEDFHKSLEASMVRSNPKEVGVATPLHPLWIHP